MTFQPLYCSKELLSLCNSKPSVALFARAVLLLGYSEIFTLERARDESIHGYNARTIVVEDAYALGFNPFEHELLSR